jgi:hypothetical protein
MEIRLIASVRTEEFFREYEGKTWHFSFIITVLAITATYFTIAELKRVSHSIYLREETGLRETHSKKLSLLTNCMICIWNMCYSITFFVTALYYKVSSFFYDETDPLTL